MDYIYFDQAASSFPKPPSVPEKMTEVITKYGANPGRSGHLLARQAGEVVYQTRVKLSQFFGEKNPDNVIFYPNATYALNQAIQGLPLQKGDHIITTHFEHNSVRRPLEFLKKAIGIELTYVLPNNHGEIDISKLEDAITPKTKAIVVSHGSNVTGAITPIETIGKMAKQHQLIFIVDASQTAGLLPINVEEMNIHCLAFPGHKSLLGPQGIGVLIVKEGVPLKPLIYGGTGGFSELVDQPEKRPERYESGTLNTPAIAGLLASLTEIEKIGINHIFAHEWQLTKHCLQHLSALEGITIYGPPVERKRLPVISFNIEGITSHEAAMIYDSHYHIGLRAGLHCSPLIHEAMGTVIEGSIRASFGYYNTIEEVNRLIEATKEIQSYFLSS